MFIVLLMVQIHSNFNLKSMYGDRVGVFTGGWIPPWKYDFYDRVLMEAILARWEATRDIFARSAHAKIRPGPKFWQFVQLMGKWLAIVGFFTLSTISDRAWRAFSKDLAKDTYGELDWNPSTRLEDFEDEEGSEGGEGSSGEGEDGEEDEGDDGNKDRR